MRGKRVGRKVKESEGEMVDFSFTMKFRFYFHSNEQVNFGFLSKRWVWWDNM
jgi:hypothetical protein